MVRERKIIVHIATSCWRIYCAARWGGRLAGAAASEG